MISLPSFTLFILYCVALTVSHNRPKYALCGLLSFVAILVSVGLLRHNQQSMIDAYGLSGFAYRWNSIMALIVFGWFILIQKSERLIIIAPVFVLLSLDVTCMLLSSYDTTLIDPYVSAAMIACHLVYISGCLHGSLIRHSNTDSSSHSGSKGNRGHSK